MDIKAVQTALKTRGFYTGGIDGIAGRLTLAAIDHLYTSEQIPGVRSLDGAADILGLSGPPIDPPWLSLAETKLGLLETDKRLFDFLRSDHKSVGDPSKLPWCGDFVETCLAVTLPGETLPANPYLARNWSTFGEGAGLRRGAVVNYWRGKPTSILGHVGFLLGVSPDRKYHRIRAGNTNNRVADAWIDAGRFVAARCPVTYPLPGMAPTLKPDGSPLSQNEA